VTIVCEKTAGTPLRSSAGYDAFETITSFVPAAIAASNGTRRAPRNAASRAIVTGRSSVLATALPRPGKCFAVAATPTRWRPRTNALTSAATVVGSLPNERRPRKLRGVEIVSATGAKSIAIPASRIARAAASAWASATAVVVIDAAASVGDAQVRRRTGPPSWSTPMRSGIPRLVHETC